MDRDRYVRLLSSAEKAVNDALHPDMNNFEISSQYNGHVASFGVSVLMSGVKPAMAFFKESASDEPRVVLDLLRRMLVDEGFDSFDSVDAMYQAVVTMDSDSDSMMLFKNSILDCSVALKHIIRTYRLV